MKGPGKKKRKSSKKVGGSGFYPKIQTPVKKALQKGAASKYRNKVKPIGWKKPKAKSSFKRTASKKRG